jgi:hypothetical protein
MDGSSPSRVEVDVRQRNRAGRPGPAALSRALFDAVVDYVAVHPRVSLVGGLVQLVSRNHVATDGTRFESMMKSR